MKNWLWTGESWRQVSPLEAKYRRHHGFTVVEAETAPKGPPKAEKPPAAKPTAAKPEGKPKADKPEATKPEATTSQPSSATTDTPKAGGAE